MTQYRPCYDRAKIILDLDPNQKCLFFLKIKYNSSIHKFKNMQIANKYIQCSKQCISQGHDERLTLFRPTSI